MLFLGDFIYPFAEKRQEVFLPLGDEFLSYAKIVNFESTLSKFNKKRIPFGTGLFSSEVSLEILRGMNVKCVSLANNHVTDFDFDTTLFLKEFKKNNISTVGFGEDIAEASRCYVDDSERLLILSYGWKSIKCVYASHNTRGVNPYQYNWVERHFSLLKEKYPNYKKVFFLHWNYEFENLPLPADRKFAHYLIDIGADLIIGHHSHVINPVEIYKGKAIFYSLGNFYFPQVKYGDVKVQFRESALLGISALYLNNAIKVYLHRQVADGSGMEMIGEYDLNSWYYSEYNIQLNGMTDLDYLKLYKKRHFHKNKLLPIYTDFRDNYKNHIFDIFVAIRQRFIDLIKK